MYIKREKDMNQRYQRNLGENQLVIITPVIDKHVSKNPRAIMFWAMKSNALYNEKWLFTEIIKYCFNFKILLIDNFKQIISNRKISNCQRSYTLPKNTIVIFKMYELHNLERGVFFKYQCLLFNYSSQKRIK